MSDFVEIPSASMKFICDEKSRDEDGKSRQTRSTDHLWISSVRTISKGLTERDLLAEDDDDPAGTGKKKICSATIRRHDSDRLIPSLNQVRFRAIEEDYIVLTKNRSETS